jgi:hypothetical protein
MKEITGNQNKGVECSVEKYAQKYNLPESEILDLLEDFKQTAEQFHIDIEGGFENFAPPPPDVRNKFREPFPENSLFEFNNSAQVELYLKNKLPDLAIDLEVLGYDEELPIDELPDFIEDLFFAYWEVESGSILLYTLYLLSIKGESFLPVRDYAVEYLRIFWHTILLNKSKKEIEKFMKSYGSFGFNVLNLAGLIETDIKIDIKSAGKADYRIKATPFFYEWIRFNRSK